MKILLLTWACDMEDVSESQIAYRWVRELTTHHDVTLFSVSRPERFGCVKQQFPDLHVIEWRDLPVPKKLERFRAIVKPGYFIYYHRARRFLKFFLKNHRFDVIHHLSPFAWRYASPAFGFGVPLVRGPVAGGLLTPKEFTSEVKETFHPFKFLRKTDAIRKKIDCNLISSYRNTDFVLIAAPYVSEILHPLPIKKLVVEIEHGNERRNHISTATPDLLYAKRKVELLFVGRIIRTKGVRDAIRAISHMAMRDSVHFSIIGDGEDFYNCRFEAISLGLTEIITFHGWCSQTQVEWAYQRADIFVFPSFREPTGGALLEAMSYGLPCVTCDYGGPGYIVDDASGIRVPPFSPDKFVRELASSLDKLVSNRELRETLGRGARNHAEKDFSWEDKMHRVNAIYRRLCSES